MCGGGVFGYFGGSLPTWAKGAHAELLGFVNYDSDAGGEHGGLFGVGKKDYTVGFESMRTWNDGKVHTSAIGIGGPEFNMPGKLKGMKGDVGGLLQYGNGQLSIGGFVGGTFAKGRLAGGGGYGTVSWSGCPI